MSDTIADRVRRYVLDGGDEDLRRLLGVSHLGADTTRSALRRIVYTKVVRRSSAAAVRSAGWP
jgi:hypothetical protein